MSNPKIKSIKAIKNLKNKTVLVRCDFDVPLKQQTTNNKQQTTKKSSVVSCKLSVADDSRLRAATPTIKYLLSKGARVVLMGHLGRPGGVVKKELSLLPVKNRLGKLLGEKISFISDEIPSLATLARDDGRLIMLENLRFNPGEEKNDPKFAKKLAKLGDIYVNEAFAVSHRSAASVDAIKKFLPSYAGLNLEQEILHLSAVLNKPQKPMVAIIGGAKIETKLPMIKQFLKSADYILIGGGVANDFLKARGYEIYGSLVDDDYINEAGKILKKSEIGNQKSGEAKLILPIDVVWSDNKIRSLSAGASKGTPGSAGGKTPKILDIGPKTIWLFSGIIKKAKTIVWNGPMGYFEDKKFATGTEKIAEVILANKKAQRIIGGGETGEVIQKIIRNQKSEIRKNIFISIGGGAMLEYLGGKKLPGLDKLIK
ncbi:MAG: phosphoglycerate kinase [Patescibacteria group bacterium]|nr:phosphoglycerate kinase [Patescibacteria group bacterium]